MIDVETLQFHPDPDAFHPNTWAVFVDAKKIGAIWKVSGDGWRFHVDLAGPPLYDGPRWAGGWRNDWQGCRAAIVDALTDPA